jgi:hypothetical protein
VLIELRALDLNSVPLICQHPQFLVPGTYFEEYRKTGQVILMPGPYFGGNRDSKSNCARAVTFKKNARDISNVVIRQRHENPLFLIW